MTQGLDQPTAMPRQNPNDADQAALEEISVDAKVLIWALLICCVVVLVWAALFKIDIVSIANGAVAASHHTQHIQNLEGGIVRELLVKEGERVEKGQLLVKLEPTQSGADVGESEARVAGLKADLARLQAEASNRKSIEFEADFASLHADAAARAISLFSARRQELDANVRTQQGEVLQREQDIAEISARLANARKRYHLAMEQVEIGEKLLANELSNRYEQIEREKEAQGIRSRIEEDTAALERAQQGAAKARAELDGIRKKYAEGVQHDLADVARQLDEAVNHHGKLMDTLTRTEVRSPIAGTVKALYFNNVGAVVRPGEIIADLVPLDDKLVIEAKLQPQDIGHIRVGQKAQLQLESAEATRYGHIEGTVIHVGPDTTTSQDGKAVYYVVRIAPSRNYLGDDAHRYELTPGVLISAGIITGRRTVLQYVLYPIMQTAPLTMSER